MRVLEAVLAIALVASPAFAQSKPAIPPADDVEAAKAHFAAGSAYYDQANYGDAVREFNEAYRLSHRSDLLYNISLCYERLSQYDNAIKALNQYLGERPDAPDKVKIQSRIENLNKLRDQQAQPKPTETTAPPPRPAETAPPPVPAPTAAAAPSVERPRRWWVPGTAVAIVGAAVLGASLGTGLAANAKYNDLVNQCGTTKVCNPSLQNERDVGQALAISSDVLLGVGAAAVVTGAILLIVQSRKPHAHAWAPTSSGVMVHF
jgi:tetratricopeptide (TPR) repeat protein